MILFPARLVEDVVKKGINYIDTAPWYGQGRSESVLGKALKYKKLLCSEILYLGTYFIL